jgi:ABC-type phosphate transport system permease subunit
LLGWFTAFRRGMTWLTCDWTAGQRRRARNLSLAYSTLIIAAIALLVAAPWGSRTTFLITMAAFVALSLALVAIAIWFERQGR